MSVLTADNNLGVNVAQKADSEKQRTSRTFRITLLVASGALLTLAVACGHKPSAGPITATATPIATLTGEQVEYYSSVPEPLDTPEPSPTPAPVNETPTPGDSSTKTILEKATELTEILGETVFTVFGSIIQYEIPRAGLVLRAPDGTPTVVLTGKITPQVMYFLGEPDNPSHGIIFGEEIEKLIEEGSAIVNHKGSFAHADVFTFDPGGLQKVTPK